jgi:tmRNA-binding protein
MLILSLNIILKHGFAKIHVTICKCTGHFDKGEAVKKRELVNPEAEGSYWLDWEFRTLEPIIK